MTTAGQPVLPQAGDRLAGLLHARRLRDALAVDPLPKRQRARLWDLRDSVHCSIIGTCLTTGELRRVMAKAMSADVSHLSDHDLHARAVGLCNRHNASSKLLQKALDARHEAVIKRFARLEGEDAAMQGWAEARRAAV